MKKSIVLILFLLSFRSAYTTNIVDVFKQLPAEYGLNLTLAEKEKLIDTYYSSTVKMEEAKRLPTGEISILIIDIKNGFMKLSTTYGDGGFELCYWNRPNAEKLIAVNHYGWATSKYTQSIDFLLLDAEAVFNVLSQKQVVPYNHIRNYLLKDNLTSSQILQQDQLELHKAENMVFELPRYGKSIIATFGVDNSENWKAELLKHVEVELIWEELNLVILNR